MAEDSSAERADATAARRLHAAITAKHSSQVADSVLDILDDLGLRARNAPNLDRRNTRQRERRRIDEEFRERESTVRHRARLEAQRSLAVTAGRRGLPWTGPEMEIAARTDLSDEQVATMTGRTLYGVEEARRRLAVDPRAITLAGVPVDQSKTD